MRAGRLTLLPVIAIISLGGCAGSGAPEPAAISCEQVIGLPEGTVVADTGVDELVPGVGFGPGEVARTHGLGRTVDIDGSDYRFAKMGLLVDPTADATLTVSARTGRALIGWGAAPAPALAFGGCADAHVDWLVFAGGIYVTEPTCVDITVERETGERFDAPIGVGVDPAVCR